MSSQSIKSVSDYIDLHYYEKKTVCKIATQSADLPCLHFVVCYIHEQ